MYLVSGQVWLFDVFRSGPFPIISVRLTTIIFLKLRKFCRPFITRLCQSLFIIEYCNIFQSIKSHQTLSFQLLVSRQTKPIREHALIVRRPAPDSKGIFIVVRRLRLPSSGFLSPRYLTGPTRVCTILYATDDCFSSPIHTI